MSRFQASCQKEKRARLTPAYVSEIAKHTLTATEYCFLIMQGTARQIHSGGGVTVCST
jgi:hypothetical protein